MTQCNTLYVIHNFNKLKSGIKHGTELTLNLSSNMIGNSNDETNFPNRLISANAHVARLRKALQITHHLI